MNRRSFLQLFGAGLPAVVVAEKFGLTKYFFAPKGGWAPTPLVYPPGALSPQAFRNFMASIRRMPMPLDELIYMHPAQHLALQSLQQQGFLLPLSTKIVSDDTIMPGTIYRYAKFADQNATVGIYRL